MSSSAPVRQLKKWIFGNRRVQVQIAGEGYNKSSLLYILKYRDKEIGQTYWNPMLDYNRETIDYPAGWEFDIIVFRSGCSQFEKIHGEFHFVTSETMVWHIHDCSLPDPSLESIAETVQGMKEKGAKYLWVLLSEQHVLSPKGDERALAVAKHKETLDAFLQESATPAGITWFFVDEPGFNLYDGTKYVLPFIKGVAKTLLEIEEKKKNIQGTTATSASNKNKNKNNNEALALREKARNDEILSKRLEQVEKAESDGLREVAVFWDNFLHARLTSWTHVDHLEAGYLVLLRSMEQGHGLLKTASVFMEHLERLRAARPDIFRNTAHFTMTAFWIIQLRVAVFNVQYEDDAGGTFPVKDQDFRDVLLLSPQLLDTRLWMEYYTKEVLFSSAARDDFVMPDVKPFPQVTKPVLAAMVKQDEKELEEYEE